MSKKVDEPNIPKRNTTVSISIISRKIEVGEESALLLKPSEWNYLSNVGFEMVSCRQGWNILNEYIFRKFWSLIGTIHTRWLNNDENDLAWGRMERTGN